jgi:Flp pilus assembly protein TadG
MNDLPVQLSTHRNFHPARKETGAVAVIVALSLVGLVGFVGLALDLGKLFVAKTELQNSADACALAAARELTGANTNQLELAEAAGRTTGERHDVLFQDEQIVISSVTFSQTLTPWDNYPATSTGTEAIKMRFARCEASKAGIANWFIQVLNLLPGTAIGDQTVAASAVASLVPGQTSCPLPVAVCESGLSGKNPGDWLESLLSSGEGITGDFLWASFPDDQDNGAKDIKNILTGEGVCNTPAVGAKVGDPGGKAGAYGAWNTRFGLYQGSYSPSTARPDLTGFTYTAISWPSCEKAFISGHFSQQRADYASFQDLKNKSDYTGLKFPVDPSDRKTHGQGDDRRLAIVPVVNCPEFEKNHVATVKKWACVLMLHPLDSGAKPTDPAFAACSSTGNSTMFLEYLGWASDPDSPCASSGVVGGSTSAGPLVPSLVR